LNTLESRCSILQQQLLTLNRDLQAKTEEVNSRNQIIRILGEKIGGYERLLRERDQLIQMNQLNLLNNNRIDEYVNDNMQGVDSIHLENLLDSLDRSKQRALKKGLNPSNFQLLANLRREEVYTIKTGSKIHLFKCGNMNPIKTN